MPELNDKILKKAYDQYQPQDFIYKDLSSTNLNPVREVKFDKVDLIIKKLQEATNDIIRKKIKTEEPEEVLRAAMGGEAVVSGIPLKKQMIVAQAGGTGGYIFPVFGDGPLAFALEQVLGTSPDLTGLDEPPVIDCDSILDNLRQQNTDIEIKDQDDDDKSDGSAGTDSKGGSGDDSGSDDSGSDDSGSDDSEEDSNTTEDSDGDEDDDSPDYEEPDEEDEVAICSQIELTWLKLILILVKILQIIKKIITMVLAILFPIIEIVMLAVGAWINPPNIAKIGKIIVQMIVAIILMVLGMILQLIWNLLNLDCVCDQTASLIKQITKALSTFSSIMGAYNSLGTSIANDINKKLLNPLAELASDLEKGKENWSKLKDQFKETFSEQGLQNMMNTAKAEIESQVKTGLANNPNIQKANGVIKDAQQMFKASDKVKEQFAKMAKAAKEGDALSVKSGATSVGNKGKSALTKFKGLVGVDMSKKEE